MCFKDKNNIPCDYFFGLDLQQRRENKETCSVCFEVEIPIKTNTKKCNGNFYASA